VYVAVGTVFEVRLIVCPTQTGELLETVGAVGTAFTVTFTVAPVLVHPLPEAVTV
jgi:hypothetical protein